MSLSVDNPAPVFLLNKVAGSGLSQEKLIAEVDALGDGFAPNHTDLEEKLPYMDAVLKETLRLFPPAHTLTREAERDMTIGGESPR